MIRERIRSALTLLAAADRRGSQAPTFRTGAARRTDLQPNPLNPSWVERGSPIPRSLTLTCSSDERLSSGLWECAAGAFNFTHDGDEIVHILEGEVTVSYSGSSHTLRPGDVAHFPAGLTTHWNVTEFVKKFWVIRYPSGSLISRLRSRVGI